MLKLYITPCSLDTTKPSLFEYNTKLLILSIFNFIECMGVFIFQSQMLKYPILSIDTIILPYKKSCPIISEECPFN